MVRKMSVRKSFILSVAAVLLIVLTGCGDKIDYSLPDNPQVFMAETYVNPYIPDDEYLSFEYRDRTYVPFGVLDGKIGATDVDRCLGFITSAGEKDTNSRVFTLTADPYHNFLVELNADGFMDAPMFYRAIDTYLEDIEIPSYIWDQDYDVWKEYDYEPVEETADEEPEEKAEDDAEYLAKVEALNEEVQSQIEVFIEHKDEWIVPYEETDETPGHRVTPSYTFCDLDLNGRCELIVIQDSYYDGVADMDIYEISADGESLIETEWEFDGLALSYPTINLDARPDIYFDSKTHTYHYILYGEVEEDRVGYTMCDMTYSNGTASVYGFQSVIVDFANDRKIFSTPEGEISENEFYRMQRKYPYDYKKYNIMFALVIYEDDDRNAVNWDDEFTSQALFDSYRVFTGQMEYGDFVKEYIPVLAAYY